MISRRTTLLLFLSTAIVALSWSASPAIAGDGYGYGFPYSWGYQSSIYSLDRIPYFSQHPPVYYSYPVPRTYGYSPYAYPPWFKTPQSNAPAPEPLTLDNPYVPKRAKAAEASDRAASVNRQPQPLVITNPYFQPASAVVDAAK